MTVTWTAPPDRTRTRRMKSATGGGGSEEVLAIRSTTGPAAGPPALSPPAVALQPAAAAATRASASRAPAFPRLMSGSRQGDVQLENGPVRGQGEHLAVRAEDRRPEQGVRRAGPFRDQPVRPVEGQ